MAKSVGGGDRLGRRHQADDELDEAQHWHRVEEVDADHLLRSLRGDAELHDRDRAGVAGEHRVAGLDDLVEAAEHVDLALLVLDDRLDDELTVGEIADVGRERDPRQRRVALVLAELAGRDRPIERLGEAPLTAFGGGRVDLGDDDVEPGASAHLGDAGAHQPTADHSDPVIGLCCSTATSSHRCERPSASEGADINGLRGRGTQCNGALNRRLPKARHNVARGSALTRRQLLAIGAAVAITPRWRGAAGSPAGANPFTLGVCAGDPDERSAVLWTRLDPGRTARRSAATTSPSRGSSPTTSRSRRSSASVRSTARADEAHSVHAVVDVAGPSFFRFRSGEWTSPIGRVAPTGTNPAQLRLATTNCQHFETGFYAAHGDLAAWAPDLVVFLGDFIYEYGGQNLGGAVVRSHGSGETFTIDEYRQRYALYLSDPQLQAARAVCPWLTIWDDHEVENNYAASTSEDAAPPTSSLARRLAAYQAWWEHMPVRIPRPTADADTDHLPDGPLGIARRRDPARRTPVPLRPGVRRRRPVRRSGLPGDRRPGAHDARLRAGAVARRAAGHDDGDVAGDRPADRAQRRDVAQRRGAQLRPVGRLPGGPPAAAAAGGSGAACRGAHRRHPPRRRRAAARRRASSSSTTSISSTGECAGRSRRRSSPRSPTSSTPSSPTAATSATRSPRRRGRRSTASSTTRPTPTSPVSTWKTFVVDATTRDAVTEI